MVRERFDESFERLRDQSNRLAATERNVDNLDEIVDQRVELDRLRHEVTDERKQIVSRFEPPAPDVVLPPRGYVNTKLFGKIAATVSVVLLAVAAFLIVKIVQDSSAQFPVEYVGFDESVDNVEPGGCQWTIRATLRNDSTETVTVTRLETVLDRQLRWAAQGDYPTLAPGDTAVATGVFRLGNLAGCPEPADVDHGNLLMHLDNGLIVSRGF